MSRFATAMGAVLAAAAYAHGHFFFILPPDGPGGGLRLVLSDGPFPDTGVGIGAVPAGRFSATDSGGTVTGAVLKPAGEGWLALAEVPAGAAEASGTVEYGVVLRGQPQPALVVHHPRAVLTPVRPGSAVGRPDFALALTPVARPGGIAFEVTAGGKPVGSADVTVYVPGEKQTRTVQTDAAGVTPAFDRPGQYAARTYRLEERAGEFQGKTYRQVRHYATLVTQYNSGK